MTSSRTEFWKSRNLSNVSSSSKYMPCSASDARTLSLLGVCFLGMDEVEGFKDAEDFAVDFDFAV